jgi:hypothetical protein
MANKVIPAPVKIAAVFLVVFTLLITIFSQPSLEEKGIEAVKSCIDTECVKAVWKEHEQEIDNKKILRVVQEKLNSFDLSGEDMASVKTWLPIPKSINLIVIPDLSNRIAKPNQIDNDKKILKEIWEAFKRNSKTKINTKDNLMVDVTDNKQANGSFSKIANDLSFDLSLFDKSRGNVWYFTKEADRAFAENVEKLYELAQSVYSGADYWFYFNRHLQNRLKKNTVFDEYINKIIIITDGYLETNTTSGGVRTYTQINGKYKNQLYTAVGKGGDAIFEVVEKNRLNIPKANVDLKDVEVLICEVRERDSGAGNDFEILKAYWEDWLGGMNAKNVVFIQQENAMDLTFRKINEFINVKR